MDKDIKDLRRRAGLQEQETYTLGSQETIDTIIKKESEFLFKLAAHLKRVRGGISPNVFNPRTTAQALDNGMKAIAAQLDKLDRLKSGE